jgi:hypothetical protein
MDLTREIRLGAQKYMYLFPVDRPLPPKTVYPNQVNRVNSS